MSRDITCPNCGATIKQDVTVQSAYDAYLAIVLGGSSAKAYGASRGLAPSTVTRYRRLGIALAVVGVDSDSALYRHLAGRGGAMIAQVGAAIEAPGATPASVEAVLRQHMSPKGKKLRKA